MNLSACNVGFGTEPSAASSGITDAALIESAQAGDNAALERLLFRHWSAFQLHAEYACGDPTAAQDVCQEACLNAISHLSRLTAANNFRAWVCGFIDNEARHWKRNLKKAGTEGTEIGTTIIETMSARVDNNSDVDLRELLAMMSPQAEQLGEP